MSNNSQPSDMQEPYPEWEEIICTDGTRYYCNNWTGKSSWTKPSGVESIPAYPGNKDLPEWEEIICTDGTSYYCNNWTGECSWTKASQTNAAVTSMQPSGVESISTYSGDKDLPEWEEMLCAGGTRYYCNNWTGESSWTKPSGVESIPTTYSGDKEFIPEWKETARPNEKRYYYNNWTGESTFDKPVVLMSPVERATISFTDWRERTAVDGRKYYYNKVTRVTKWSMPEELKLAREQAQRAVTEARGELTGANRGLSKEQLN